MENNKLVPERINKNNVLLFAMDLPANKYDRADFLNSQKHNNGEYIHFCFGNKDYYEGGENAKVRDFRGYAPTHAISDTEIAYDGNFYSKAELSYDYTGKGDFYLKVVGDKKDSILRYFGKQDEKTGKYYMLIDLKGNNGENIKIAHDYLNPRDKKTISSETINNISDIINNAINKMVKNPTNTADNSEPVSQNTNTDEEYYNF